MLSFRPLLIAAALLLGARISLAQSPPGSKAKWDSVTRDIFRELIEINTENSDGSTLVAAEALAKRFRAAGFPDSDIVVVSNAPKKGNIVVRLRGKNTGKKAVLLLSHLDVVEAKPADWTLPPFTFIEKDGTFFGRGVSDNKDDVAIHASILMRMKAEGYVPDRDIIMAATTDEEGGGANGAGFLMREHKELIDAEFAFNEGGGGRMHDSAKVSHDVQASEKKVQTFTIETFNSGGHSSVPRADNAITQLAVALSRLTPTVFPVHLNEITRAYFTKVAPTLKDEAPALSAAIATIVKNPADAAAAKVISVDPRYNSQLRTTCVATMLTGGHASNALPQRAQATVNCRVLPDETPEYVQSVLQKLVADTGVHVVPVGAARNSPPSPLTPELMGEIERITKEMWPGIPVIPTMGAGATDGVSLRLGGIPTYGVAGQFYGESNAHGMNERIPVKAFYESLDFMYRLVRAVTGDRKPVS